MSQPEPPGPSPADRAQAKAEVFASLGAERAEAGHPVGPRLVAPAKPAPPAPPPPALSFEVWAELSVRFPGPPQAVLVRELFARGLTLDVWRHFDDEYHRALSDDRRAGRKELSAVYEAKYKEEQAHHTGAPALPADEIAPDALRGTAGLRDLPGTMMEEMGRTPFVPPAPEAAASGKRPAKTAVSKVVASSLGQTMPLDADVVQRPTPSLPFVGGNGSDGVLPVRELTAHQWVGLQVELMLQVAPREETLRRYWVPTEAVYRAIEEGWGRPSRRAELERALGAFGSSLRGELFG